MTRAKGAVLSAMVLVAASVAHADAGADEPVRQQVERIVPAWNSHDMKAFSQLFGEDADFVNVVGTWWKGREQIEAAHVATHQSIFKNSHLSGQIASLKRIRPEVAVVHFTWTLSGSTAPDGQAVRERKGILVFVLTREAGSWIIRAAQNTDIVEGGAVQQVGRKSKT